MFESTGGMVHYFLYFPFWPPAATRGKARDGRYYNSPMRAIIQIRKSSYSLHPLTASLSSCLIASTPLFVWVEVATVIFHTHIFNYANLDAWYWWSKEYQIYQWKDARFSKSCFIILIKTIVDQSQKIGRGLVCTTFNTEQSKMHVWGILPPSFFYLQHETELSGTHRTHPFDS